MATTETMEKYKNGLGVKKIKLWFPDLNLNLDNSSVYEDSLVLQESLFDSNSIEFVGCISSKFKIELHGVKQDLKDKRIVASISLDDDNDWITIFNGVVDSVKTELDRSFKEITCYDNLYFLAANKDIASWYKGLSFPITMKALRNSLFSYIGIQQEEQELVNDNIVIKKQYDPKLLNALDVIKNICQFNGVMGIINRKNKFEYRVPMTCSIESVSFPSMHTFPSLHIFPNKNASGESGSLVNNEWYMDMQYEDFVTNKITRVTFRNDDSDIGISYGDGVNNYIIQNNIFAYGLSDAERLDAAKNVYKNVNNFQYRPVDLEVLGLPFAEVGCSYSFYVMDWLSGEGKKVTRTFPLLNRTMKGIQKLTDSCGIDGEKNQSVFVTNLNVKVDLLANTKSLDNYYTKEETDQIISEMETPTGFDIVSVYTLSGNIKSNTLYCIQGGVIML